MSYCHLNTSVVFVSDPRTDIRNNENKLAEEMATNAQSASLLRRKHPSSKSGGHQGAVFNRLKSNSISNLVAFSVQFRNDNKIPSAIICYSVWEIPLSSLNRLCGDIEGGHTFGMSSLRKQGCSKTKLQQMIINWNAALDMTVFIQMVLFFPPRKCTILSFLMKWLIFISFTWTCISICWKTILVNLESDAFQKTFRFFYFGFVTDYIKPHMPGQHLAAY